jgi:hypothetical protein
VVDFSIYYSGEQEILSLREQRVHWSDFLIEEELGKQNNKVLSWDRHLLYGRRSGLQRADLARTLWLRTRLLHRALLVDFLVDRDLYYRGVDSLRGVLRPGEVPLVVLQKVARP